MQIVVSGNESSFNELSGNQNHIKWLRVSEAATFINYKEADAFFILDEDISLVNFTSLQSPVFINRVTLTNGNDKNLIRINGWHGFLEKDTWEIAGLLSPKASAVLSAMNKKIIVTADIPGFISARIVAMIINEAYFAKADDVSTEKEIDIAMKLGTNYPYGPFEWGEKIGLKNIYDLLVKLAEQDKKYSPSLLLANVLTGL